MSDPEVSDYLSEMTGSLSEIESGRTDYGDLSVVDRTNIFDYSSAFPLNAQRDIYTTTNATIGNTDGEYHLHTNANTNGAVSLETADLGVYVPDYAGIAGAAMRLPTQPTGSQEIRWGYFDGQDGAFWGYDSTGVYCAIMRNGSVSSKAYQSNWNLDTMDGSGDASNPSGLDLSPADGNIFHIVLALYNEGTLTFQVLAREPPSGDNPNKLRVVDVHRFAPRGESTLNVQNLPIRVAVDNGGAADTLDAYVGGRQFSIKGAYTAVHRVKSEFRINASYSGTAWTPIVAFRRKAAQEFKQAPLQILGYDVSAADDLILQIRTDATTTGGSYGTPSTVNASSTAVETNTGVSGITISSGDQRYEGFHQGAQGSHTTISSFSGIDVSVNRQQQVVLAARPATSASGNVTAVVRWQEEW